MKSLSKRLSQFAAMTCIGLAGSAVAVFAQGPAPVKPEPGFVATNGPAAPPFKCEAGEMGFKDGNGTVDNFAGTGVADPKPHPSGIPGLNATTNIYDQTASDYHFGDSFPLNKPGQITKIRVTTRLKANSNATNDGISFSTVPTFSPGHISFSLPSWTAGQNKQFWFDLVAGAQLGMTSLPPTGAVPLPNVPVNFFGTNPPFFHVYVQDDTSVDFIQIEGCYKPAPKYDLVASKKHDGNVYILNVHNNSQQPIMPTGKVDVVELVPAGLTITSFPSGPWTCTGSLPVVGPDSFTCSYQIPSGGIAAGSNLPQIVLKSEGKAECPNCMRVKLYLKEVAGGATPVDEGDMKNNVSCTN